MMTEESAVSILRKMPETKAEGDNFVRLVRQAIEDGEVDPLLVYKNIGMLEMVFKKLKGDIIIRDIVLEAAEKFGAKSFEYQGAKYAIREVGVKYDYAGCGDQEWNDLDYTIRNLTERKKEREELLRAITPEMEVYGADGVKLEPAIKTSTTSIVLTLK